MIKIDKVNKYYNKGKTNQIHVINDTSMLLPDKGIVCLLGPSGCGKTTLLNAIGGLDTVDSGTISINEQQITRASSNAIDNIRNADIGYIFQNFNLLEDRTVFENVAVALRMIGIKDNNTITNRVRYCLEKVGIDQYRNKLAGSLSGGQRQRVAIARAIVKNPKIIIADEPTGNLDSANTLEIMNLIKAFSKERLVILVTHERNLAHFYSDSIAEIQDGKIVNTYDNDSSRFLDYQLEGKIYLKDLAIHKELRQDEVRVDVYSDTERPTAIKAVIKDNNLYIDTGGKLNVVDEKSRVELVDAHYEAMDERCFEDYDFDYDACLPPGHKAKYTSVYSFKNILSSGWKRVADFRGIKRILMLGFVFAAMFAFLAISNVRGLLEVKPTDYRTTNGNYITIPNAEKRVDLLDVIDSLETVAYVLPGETKKSVSLPLDDYLQTKPAQEDITVSIVLTSVLEPGQLVLGSMPVKPHDVVIDKVVLDKFFMEDLGKAIGLSTMEDFIGRRITVPNLDDYRIVGITDTESPSLYVDPDEAMHILANAADVSDEISFGLAEGEDEEVDAVASGSVMDLDIAKGNIQIEKGNKPENLYETIINEEYKGDAKIGKEIGPEINGHKLTVVGYYSSNYADDDTYYVNSETIRLYYIGKQKSFSAYAPDVKLLKAILDQAGFPSSVNDIRDRNAYINARKDQLISALIVAGIIMLISLIEMFLMLRASFLSRIKEVGTLRAIGLKKGDIYKMFLGEILVITFITAVPGIAVMYLALAKLANVTYSFEGIYMLTPEIAGITFAIILVFNLIAGLIPVFTTMRKTPAQILARTDI